MPNNSTAATVIATLEELAREATVVLESSPTDPKARANKEACQLADGFLRVIQRAGVEVRLDPVSRTVILTVKDLGEPYLLVVEVGPLPVVEEDPRSVRMGISHVCDLKKRIFVQSNDGHWRTVSLNFRTTPRSEVTCPASSVPSGVQQAYAEASQPGGVLTDEVACRLSELFGPLLDKQQVRPGYIRQKAA